jgi:multiple sugar transport system permease protein
VNGLRRAVRGTTIVVVSLLWLLPSYLLLVNGMTPADQYSGDPSWLPNGVGLLDNVRAAWTDASLGPAMSNSLLYGLVGALAAVAVASLAAFATVVMPVRRPVLWFWLIYVGTLLPLQVFIRPLFSAYAEVDLYDTQLGLIVIYVAFCIPFAYFVMRNYVATVPREMTEAARLDGASWWRLFWRIHVPLSKSAMVAAFVFQFVAVWNDLLFGISLTTSPNIRPVMAALADLQGTYAGTAPPVALGGALVVSLPTIVLFFAAQRYFVASLKLNL